MTTSKSTSRKPSAKKSPEPRKSWPKLSGLRHTLRTRKVKKQGPRAPIIPCGHGE